MFRDVDNFSNFMTFLDNSRYFISILQFKVYIKIFSLNRLLKGNNLEESTQKTVRALLKRFYLDMTINANGYFVLFFSRQIATYFVDYFWFLVPTGIFIYVIFGQELNRIEQETKELESE